MQPSDLTGENFEFLINKYNYGKITWKDRVRQFHEKKERTASLDYVMFSPKGFTYVDDASWTVNQRKRFETSPNLREDFLVKTDDEVRMAVFDKISSLQDPVQGSITFIYYLKLLRTTQAQTVKQNFSFDVIIVFVKTF